MSDTQKPVEETVAAPAPAETTTDAAPAAEQPAAASTEPAAEAPKEEQKETTEAAAAEAPKEEAKEEAKEEVPPATDATLGYKGPGLVKSLRFSKRYFYFSDEAVEAKNLSNYIQGEKNASAAHKTAAWATQTGKGLLFFTKRAEDKATPAGIFLLADVTDVTKESGNEFSFKVGGQKHTFQASSASERDSWVATIKAKSSEAAAEKETITNSDGYKAELEKFSKPASDKSSDKGKEAAPKEETAEDKEDKKEEKKTEEKKSRSQSRKRTSLFGNILSKKEHEEKKEEKKEEAEAKPEEAPAAETAAAAETNAEAGAASDSAASKGEDKKETKEEAKPSKSKRGSIFGNFFHKGSAAAPEKTEKETTPVSSTAPQLENPVEESGSKPAESENAAAAPASETPAAETTEATEEAKDAKDAAAPASPAKSPTEKEKRKSFFGSLGKKDKPEETSDAEGKPKNKLGSLFRRNSKAVKSEEPKDKDKDAVTTEPIPEGDKPEPISKDAPAEEKAGEAAAPAEEKKTEADGAANQVNVASTATPVQAAA